MFDPLTQLNCYSAQKHTFVIGAMGGGGMTIAAFTLDRRTKVLLKEIHFYLLFSNKLNTGIIGWRKKHIVHGI